MVPDIRFKLSQRVSSWEGRLPIELGNFPLMLFDIRPKLVNWVQLLKEDKKDQSGSSRWLRLKSKYVKFCKDPKGGIAPENELLARSRTCRLVQLESEAGIFPSNLLSSKINV
jgi:hypothetical protein